MNRKGIEIAGLPLSTVIFLVINGLILILLVVFAIGLIELFSSGEENFRAQRNVKLLADRIDDVAKFNLAGKEDASVLLNIPDGYRLLLFHPDVQNPQRPSGGGLFVYENVQKPRKCNGKSCICVVREKRVVDGDDLPAAIVLCRTLDFDAIVYRTQTVTGDWHDTSTLATHTNPAELGSARGLVSGVMRVGIMIESQNGYDTVTLFNYKRLDCDGNAVNPISGDNEIRRRCHGKVDTGTGSAYGLDVDRDGKVYCYRCEQLPAVAGRLPACKIPEQYEYDKFKSGDLNRFQGEVCIEAEKAESNPYK